LNSKRLKLPLAKKDLIGLRAGELVTLTGTLFTLRDAGHIRLLQDLKRIGKLPLDLAGQTIFYAGPTPESANRPFGAIGPTTSSRMDFAAPVLYKAGITATIGKGTRSPEVVQACKDNIGVYFIATGGAAAYLAKCVKSSMTLAYDELGTESLKKIEVVDFPVFVGIDVYGNELDPTVSKTQKKQSINQSVFITFEGGEGSGKSTHINFLAGTLEQRGYEVLCIREPGGTEIGEKLRRIVLDANHSEMSDVAELFLYEAARAQLVSQVIKPALDRGAVVLCDRFSDSTVAYQAYGRGLAHDFIHRANDFAAQGLTPDRTIVLHCGKDAATGLKRATKHAMADRLEGAGKDFHKRVNNAFLEVAQHNPKRIRVVESVAKKSQTSRKIFQSLGDLFPWMQYLLDDDDFFQAIDTGSYPDKVGSKGRTGA